MLERSFKKKEITFGWNAGVFGELAYLHDGSLDKIVGNMTRHVGI